MNSISIQSGGVFIKDDSILLVQIPYGANSGLWMLPGGFHEEGESIEEAACREFLEETGIVAEADRIVGIRSGTREAEGRTQTTLYFVFEMLYRSGSLKKADSEISDLRYWSIHELENTIDVVELSKEIALNAWYTRNGLYKGKDIQVNNNYKSYSYYIANRSGS